MGWWIGSPQSVAYQLVVDESRPNRRMRVLRHVVREYHAGLVVRNSRAPAVHERLCVSATATADGSSALPLSSAGIGMEGWTLEPDPYPALAIAAVHSGLSDPMCSDS